MSMDHDDYATLARIEDHLRRIADALEATGQESRQVDLTEPTDDDLGEYPTLRCAVYGPPAASHWDDCETRDPNRCDPGCVRPSLHDGDCSPAVANEYAPGGWASEPRPEPEREPVVDLMAALKASVEAARKRREAVSGASIEPDPVAEAENGATD